MLEKIIIIAAAYFLYAVVLISIPLKRKNVKNKCGNCILSFEQNPGTKNIAILIVAALVIPIIYFFGYQLYVNLIIAGCGVLGAYIAAREIALSDFYGVYENGFCADGIYIPFEKISSVIDIDNQAQVTYAVRVTYKNNKTQTVNFASESVKKITLAKLKELKVL